MKLAKKPLEHFNGLSTVNIELSSKCNKNCWMCGRRKIDREFPAVKKNYGFMDFELLRRIESQLPEDIVVQFHNNGEPLLYPQLKEALELFEGRIRCFNTNGKLLMKKFDDIVGNMETLTISVIEFDDEADSQFEIIKEFLEAKGDKSPYVVLRLLGSVSYQKYAELGNSLVATRLLHESMGSYKYKKGSPTIPEIGICSDLLHHLAIDKDGQVSYCVRFDPNREAVIGDCKQERLVDIWNSDKRKEVIKKHVQGKREGFCAKCEYWGVPTGY